MDRKPLTLAQIKDRDLCPVWVHTLDGVPAAIPFADQWAIVCAAKDRAESLDTIYRLENYGKTWLAWDSAPPSPSPEKERLAKSIETLNFYRNRYYNASSGTEEHEIANAINDILPLISQL